MAACTTCAITSDGDAVVCIHVPESPVTDTSTECLRRDADTLVRQFIDEIAQLTHWSDPSGLRELGNIARHISREFGRVGAVAHNEADRHVVGIPRVKNPDDLDETAWEDDQ